MYDICAHLTDMCVSSSSSSSSSTESATRPGRDSMHATKYSVILFQIEPSGEGQCNSIVAVALVLVRTINVI